MTVVVLSRAAVAFYAVFVALPEYVWRRLVRETTPRRSTPQRIGNVVFIAWPVHGLAAIDMRPAADRQRRPRVIGYRLVDHDNLLRQAARRLMSYGTAPSGCALPDGAD